MIVNSFRRHLMTDIYTPQINKIFDLSKGLALYSNIQTKLPSAMKNRADK